MTIEQTDIADLDVIFLTYDEPKKEEFWIKIQNIVPWAKRVDGVKGSDAAHKAAALASDTDRFILIDGDNIPDPEFFNQMLTITDFNKHCVFRWKARNEINGLQYGNGGVSCWTKDFVMNMRTHENSDGTDENDIEFCFYSNYWAMHDCYSTTYPNGSPFQAWRAGFREGVKMCLDRGVKPSLTDFHSRVHSRNYDHLCVWQSVGLDVENGEYAILGARMGTYLTMLDTSWDYKLVQDFDALEELYVSKNISSLDEKSIRELLKQYGDELRTRLGLNITLLDAQQSKFFKHHYKSNYTNIGIMNRE